MAANALNVPLLELRRDVCVTSFACDDGRVRPLQLRAASSVPQVPIEKTFAGLTVLLHVRHGVSRDWANYAHLTSAALTLVAAAELDRLPRTAAEWLLKSSTAGLHVGLPQVVGERRSCGHPRLPALEARGSWSEVFAMVAMIAASSLLAAATTSGAAAAANTSGLGHESLLLCHELSARRGAHTCFDAVARVGRAAPPLSHLAAALSAAAASRIGARVRHAAFSLLGMSPPRPPRHRRVVVLTRRTQSAWVNRAAAIARMRSVVRGARGSLVDAGDAEDLGRDGAGCYRAAPQVALWAGAWLVVSVAGAHEASVVYMPAGAAGLLEALNCGHATETYATFARVAGVGHAASHEERQPGHGWLRSAAPATLRQACRHVGGAGERGLPAARCSAAALLARSPRLYERKRCAANLSATKGIYFHMPRVVRLAGARLDLLAALRARLALPALRDPGRADADTDAGEAG